MRRPAPRWALLVGLLLLVANLACAARQLREAQDLFNEAARAENAQRAQVFSGGAALLDASAAASGYRLSLKLLDEELAGHEAKLREERLFGTALVLKALCLWRLDDLEDADLSGELSATLARIQKEQTANTLTLGTRDRVMVAALDGLRDHDRGLKATDLASAQANFESALQVTEGALTAQNPPPNHPVRIYLRLSQLATLRAWQAAVWQFMPNDSPARRELVQRIHGGCKEVGEQLEKPGRTDPELRRVVTFYRTAIGC